MKRDLRLSICDLRTVGVVLLLLLLGGCSTPSLVQPASSPATQPAASPEDLAAWKEISDELGKQGVARDGVYTITFPRDDLFVSIEGMDVPAAAGIESAFRFYRCSCGKMSVIGQFVVADYEANDVVFALQKQDIVVSSIGPFLMYEKPRLTAVRFQGEGQPRVLARALRDALNWTGKNRLRSQKPG